MNIRAISEIRHAPLNSKGQRSVFIWGAKKLPKTARQERRRVNVEPKWVKT